MKSAQPVLNTFMDYYIRRGVQVLWLSVLPMLSSIVYYFSQNRGGYFFSTLLRLKLTLKLHDFLDKAFH